MRINLLSRRYAQAVFELATEYKQVDRVNTDLLLVAKVFTENRPLKALIKNPVIDAKKKVKILQLIFSKDVCELSMKFLSLITRKGREAYIPYICDAYHHAYQEHKNILNVNLTTAITADADLKKDVIRKMTEATKMNIELHEKVEEKLVGGFVLHFEDYQYDVSILSDLNKLRSAFSHEHYIKKY